MKLTYPAIFYPWNEGEGYTVEFPDLPGCITEGHSLADAIFMAEDAASGWVLHSLENGKLIPNASKLSDVKPEENGFTNLIALDMKAYAEKYGKKAIRKNITIPAWLNTFAEEYKINYSKSLQNILIKAYEDVRKYEDEHDDTGINNMTAEKLLEYTGIEAQP